MKIEYNGRTDRPPRFIRRLARKTPDQIAKMISKKDIVGDAGRHHHPFCFWLALETNTTTGWLWYGNVVEVHGEVADYHPQYWRLPDSVMEFGDRFYDGEYPELVLTEDHRSDGVLALLVERVDVNGGAEPANPTCYRCGVEVEFVRHRVDPASPGLPLCDDCGRNRPTWSEDKRIYKELMRRCRERDKQLAFVAKEFGHEHVPRIEEPTRAQVAQDLGIGNW